MSVPIASPKTTQDFTISPSGEGYMSQSAMALLCGVTQSAISKFVTRSKQSGIPLILNEKNQLHEVSVVEGIAYYVNQGNEQAIKSTVSIMRAGVRAYIYSAAGYTPEVPKQTNPMFECSLSNHDIYVWLATRKPSSIIRTLKLASQRCRGTALESQCWYDGVWHVSPAFLLAAPFSGPEMFRLKAKLCEQTGLIEADKVQATLTVNANFGALV